MSNHPEQHRIEKIAGQVTKELCRLLECQRLSWDLACDQVQEAWLKWWRMPPESRSQPEVGKEREWLLRCIWNRMHSHFRRRASRAAVEAMSVADWPAVVVRTPLDELIEREQEDLDETIRRILQERLTTLRGRRRRRIYELRVVHGWGFRQIADELHVCERTVRLDMEQVRGMLRAELGRLGWSLR